MQCSLHHWLAAFYLPAIGPRQFLTWLKYFPDIKAFWSSTPEELLAVGIPKQHLLSILNPNHAQIEKDLKWLALSELHHLITFDDPAYPPLLKEMCDPPLVLFVQGEKTLLSKVQIALVGSRRASLEGLRTAEQFAFELVNHGYVITSGLALGIDGASHQGALSAKGFTIGITGTGLQHIYPRCHTRLVKQIIETGGAIVSEFPLNTPPRANNFPKRNRIIAGLSVGVLVVEATLKSGSLITARFALEQGKEIFAIPGSINTPHAKGTHYLIRQGAKLVETIADITTELPYLTAACLDLTKREIKNEVPTPLIPMECRSVYEQIHSEMTPIDVIILRSGLTATQVSSMLLTLELQGYIQAVKGGYVRVY
jgi:DNA processing protein